MSAERKAGKLRTMDGRLSSVDHVREQVIDLLIQFGPKLLTAIGECYGLGDADQYRTMGVR